MAFGAADVTGLLGSVGSSATAIGAVSIAVLCVAIVWKSVRSLREVVDGGNHGGFGGGDYGEAVPDVVDRAFADTTPYEGSMRCRACGWRGDEGELETGMPDDYDYDNLDGSDYDYYMHTATLCPDCRSDQVGYAGEEV